MRWVAVVLVFFLFGALLVVSNNNLDMFEEGSLGNFTNLYLGWFSQVYSGTISFTANVVKDNWGNETAPQK